MDKKCSVFKNAWDDTSTNYVKVSTVLKHIKNGRWKDAVLKIRETKEKSYRDKLKLALPGACFSGTFKKELVYNNRKGKKEYKARMDDNILNYSGIVIVDIDIKNQVILTRLKNQFQEDPYVYSFFTSPSGGLKVLYVVNSNAQQHKKYAYEQIKGWVEDNYDIEVDRSGKNISRLCYVSYDPELFLNEDYCIFDIDATVVNEEEERYNHDFTGTDIETDIDEVYRIAKGWLAGNGDHYVQGNRNDYIHKITCVLNRAGLTDSQILFAIFSNHSISQKMAGEIKDTVTSCCRRNSGEFGSKPIYSVKKKRKSSDLSSFL